MNNKKLKTFEGFKFSEISKAKLDKLYIKINFAGGDADTEHPEEYDLGIKFSEYNDHLEKIQKEIDLYKTLEKILNINSAQHLEDYREVDSKYGEEMAMLFDNTPNDPQSDYQFKCYISNILLIGYDKNGNKHQAYV